MLGAASADPVSSNGHSGHAPELGTLSSVVTPPALAPNAPGKSNAYDAEEEREVDMAPLAPVQAADPSTSPSVTPAKRPAESGRRELPDDMTREIGARAGDLSTASPVDASGTAPSASAVASTNELVLSPVKVEGQSVRDTRKFGGDLQSATAGDQEAQTQVDQVVSAIDEPAAAGAPKVENQTMPLSERESMTQDAQTADARPAGLTATSAAPSVAPAVAAMGGVSGPSALPGSMPHVGASPIASGSGTEEPPAKRARKASQKFAGYETPKPASSSSSSSPHAHRPIVMTQAQLKFAQSSVKSLRSRPESPAFLAPVDPIALGVPMYHQIITHPMDLGTIDLKLALTGMAMKSGKPTDKAKQAQKTGLDPTKDVYPDIPAFEADVRLVFANCARFNGPDSPYTHNALTLEKVFDKQMKSVPAAPAEVRVSRWMPEFCDHPSSRSLT